MRGICHILSRGRHLSPSLPDDSFLNHGSKSDHRAEISANIVRYDALAPRPEVLRSFSSFYPNNVFWVLFFAQAQVSERMYSTPLNFFQNNNFCLFRNLALLVWMDAEFILVYDDTKISKNRTQLAEKLPSISRERVLKMGNFDQNANGENFAKFPKLADCLP